MAMRLIRDENGAVLVEATVMLTLMLTFVLGAIDFLFALHQWNAAAKATESWRSFSRDLLRSTGLHLVFAKGHLHLKGSSLIGPAQIQFVQ